MARRYSSTSITSGAKAGNVTGTQFGDTRGFKIDKFTIYIDISGALAVGTLTLQDSPDGGTTWFDVPGMSQVIAGPYTSIWTAQFIRNPRMVIAGAVNLTVDAPGIIIVGTSPSD